MVLIQAFNVNSIAYNVFARLNSIKSNQNIFYILKIEEIFQKLLIQFEFGTNGQSSAHAVLYTYKNGMTV